MSVFIERFALERPPACLLKSRKVSANLPMCRGWWAQWWAHLALSKQSPRADLRVANAPTQHYGGVRALAEQSDAEAVMAPYEGNLLIGQRVEGSAKPMDTKEASINPAIRTGVSGGALEQQIVADDALVSARRLIGLRLSIEPRFRRGLFT